MDRLKTGARTRAQDDPQGAYAGLPSRRSRDSAMSTQQPGDTPGHASCPSLIECLRRDRLLLTAFVICGLLIGFQAGVTIVQPAWAGPVTDWLRTAFAWPEFLIVASMTVWLNRARHSAARSWRMWSAALLAYAVAQTLWSLSDQLIFHHKVPIPAAPDLFYVLQYPFFFLAVILLPRTPFWGSRLILTLDAVLIMGAVVAFSWDIILAPIYAMSGMPPLTRATSLAYPIGDLFVLFGLTITLLRPRRYRADRLVVGILVLAVICLIIADSWAAWLDLRPPHIYGAGSPPDAFWFAFYLLIPLAGLCQVRMVQLEPRWGSPAVAEEVQWRSVQWQDFTASLRFFFPIVLALVASGIIMIGAIMSMVHSGWRHEILPFALSSCLLLLILARQELAFLEMAQIRREAEYARAREQAAIELNLRKDDFLNIISHELKTPLTSLQGYIELVALRFSTQRATEEASDKNAFDVTAAQTTIRYAEDSLHRIAQLVDELLDGARIREGRLVLHLEHCNLDSIVLRAVDEQRMLAPGRAILLTGSASHRVFVVADTRRMGQVVTNFLTNALKYSKDDRPVGVLVEVTGELARVSVRDEGIGIPLAEQANVWERFHPIAGNAVQSGSGVSLGVGLHICKSIIEGHHGRVGVDSTPGVGSTFWFTLPLAIPVPDHAESELGAAS